MAEAAFSGGMSREDPCAWWAGLIGADDCALRQVRRTVLQRLQQRRTSSLRCKRFASQKYDTWHGLSRVGEDLREFEVVRENDVFRLSGEVQISVSDAVGFPASDQWSAS